MNQAILIRIINQEIKDLQDILLSFNDSDPPHPVSLELCESKIKNLSDELKLLKEIAHPAKQESAHLPESDEQNQQQRIEQEQERLRKEEESRRLEAERIAKQQELEQKEREQEQERLRKEEESRRLEAERIAKQHELEQKEREQEQERLRKEEESRRLEAERLAKQQELEQKEREQEQERLRKEEESRRVEAERLAKQQELEQKERELKRVLHEEELNRLQQRRITEDENESRESTKIKSKKDPKSSGKVLGEELGTHKKSLHDLLSENTSNKALATQFKQLPVTDIHKAIPLNDRIWFIRDLFDQQPELYQQTIEDLNRSESLHAALEYLQSRFDWDSDSKVVEKFLRILSRKF